MAISWKVCETRLKSSTWKITQSIQAESVLLFVPAIMVRKSLLAVRQARDKETSSFNELGNPSSRNPWCELTFHSLSREAFCPSVMRNQSQTWRKEKRRSCCWMHSPSLTGSAGASSRTGQALPHLDFPKPEQDLAMTMSDCSSSRQGMRYGMFQCDVRQSVSSH